MTRSIAVVGLRTGSHAGWRADIATTLEVVSRHRYLWLLGIIGFSLRGGIVLLTLPIVVLPTQVEVRLALGNNLTSTGLSDGFWLLVAGLTLLTLSALLVVLYVLARVEIASFARLARDPASAEQRAGIQPRPLSRHTRRGLETRLYLIQSVALLALLVSAVPLAAAIGDATFSEVVAPSSSEPIYWRVLGRVRELLLLVVAAVFVVEVLSATASRGMLTRAFGLTRRGNVAQQPARMLLNAAAGWALFISAIALGAWGISLAWQAARSVFLSDGWANETEQLVAMLGASTLLAAVFSAALLLGGVVSALRAALWSLASLR